MRHGYAEAVESGREAIERLPQPMRDSARFDDAGDERFDLVNYLAQLAPWELRMLMIGFRNSGLRWH